MSVIEGVDESLEICLNVTEALQTYIFRQYKVETPLFGIAKCKQSYIIILMACMKYYINNLP